MSYNVLRTTEFEKELKQLSKKYASLKGEYGDFVMVSIYDKSEQSTITDKVIQDRLKRFRK